MCVCRICWVGIGLDWIGLNEDGWVGGWVNREFVEGGRVEEG